MADKITTWLADCDKKKLSRRTFLTTLVAGIGIGHVAGRGLANILVTEEQTAHNAESLGNANVAERARTLLKQLKIAEQHGFLQHGLTADQATNEYVESIRPQIMEEAHASITKRNTDVAAVCIGGGTAIGFTAGFIAGGFAHNEVSDIVDAAREDVNLEQQRKRQFEHYEKLVADLYEKY